MSDVRPCPPVAALDSLGATLNDDLGWLLLRAGRGMSCLIAEAMAALDLDMRSAMVLKTMSGCSAPKQLAIAQAADIDKTTLVAVLDDLERKQLVRRLPDPNDRRARVVELTDEGRTALAWCQAAIADIQTGLLDAFDASDRGVLLRALPILISAIDRAAHGEEI